MLHLARYRNSLSSPLGRPLHAAMCILQRETLYNGIYIIKRWRHKAMVFRVGFIGNVARRSVKAARQVGSVLLMLGLGRDGTRSTKSCSSSIALRPGSALFSPFRDSSKVTSAGSSAGGMGIFSRSVNSSNKAAAGSTHWEGEGEIRIN